MYKTFPENTETQPINPPSASEPVSPINIEALFVLNIRNADIAPAATKHKYAKHDNIAEACTPGKSVQTVGKIYAIDGRYEHENNQRNYSPTDVQ